MNIPNLNNLVNEEMPGGYAPRVLPAVWKMFRHSIFGEAQGYQKIDGTRALLSLSTMRDGSRWLHLSVSVAGKVPTWEQLLAAKRLFLGDVEATQTFPREADYVNIANCLHLWVPLESESR